MTLDADLTRKENRDRMHESALECLRVSSSVRKLSECAFIPEGSRDQLACYADTLRLIAEDLVFKGDEVFP